MFLPSSANREERVGSWRNFTSSSKKKKKTKVVKRLVERPKTVYERFPAFEKGKVLDFTELFKGRVVPKPRIGKRPLTGKIYIFLRPHLNLECLE